MTMTTRYTVVDGEVIAEKRNGVRKQYVPDPLGSTVALLDNTQTQTDTFSYWPYGEIASRTGTTPTPFQYAGTHGYHQDSANRTYVRARTLNTQFGRWLTQDPIGFHGDDFNVYRYVVNNPTVNIDPLGLAWCCIKIGSWCIGTCCNRDPQCQSKTRKSLPKPAPKSGPPQLPPKIGDPISSPVGSLSTDACGRIINAIKEGAPIDGVIRIAGPILSGATNGKQAIDACKNAAQLVGSIGYIIEPGDKEEACKDCCAELLTAINASGANIFHLCELWCLRAGVVR